MPARKRTSDVAATPPPKPSVNRLPWAPAPPEEASTSKLAKRPRQVLDQASGIEPATQKGFAEKETPLDDDTEHADHETAAPREQDDEADQDWNLQRRVEALRAIWRQGSAGEDTEDLSSATFNPENSTKDARFLFRTLAAAFCSEGAAALSRAVTNVFRLSLLNSTDPVVDVKALLKLLLRRNTPSKAFQLQLHSAVTEAFNLKEMARKDSRNLTASDLASAAQSGRQKQSVLLQPKPLAASEVAEQLAERNSKLSEACGFQLQKLFARCDRKSEETYHLLMVLQGQIPLSDVAVLRALSAAVVFAKRSPCEGCNEELLEQIASTEDCLARAYSEDCSSESFAPAVISAIKASAKFMLPSLMRCGSHAMPMRPQMASSLQEVVDERGQDTPLWADWDLDGERLQIHVRESAVQEVFASSGQEISQERIADVASAVNGHFSEATCSCVLEALLMRVRQIPRKKNDEVEEQEPAPLPTVAVFDMIFANGESLTRTSLRERHRLLRSLMKEGPRVRFCPGQEINAMDQEKIKAELNRAISAFSITSKDDKPISKARGLILKCLDGGLSEYFAGRRGEGWQSLTKPTATGLEAERLLFENCLSEEERQCLVGSEEFHFCVVSARRTQTAEGVKGIMCVERQFSDAGVKPTWYVDEASLQGYCDLGLDAKIGGKLIPARNLALEDASALKKVCVQVSDDIARWDYYHSDEARVKGLCEANSASKRADRYHVSPVAAARFILAKMRGAPDPKPQLGGVYPLANLGQSFHGPQFSTRNFILGDFFVVDKSSCRFDVEMSLKEDYDFTCSHLKAHGTTMRCNRLLIQAKHETNAGGACSERDAAGTKERFNISILQRKWPGAIVKHNTRANQVVLRWERLEASD